MNGLRILIKHWLIYVSKKSPIGRKVELVYQRYNGVAIWKNDWTCGS